MRMRPAIDALIAGAGLAFALYTPAGLFESSTDVGATPKAGSIEYRDGAYRITGGGANMWGAEDAFHFLWKRMSGDVTLEADVRFEGQGVNAHRKAVLVVRQDLTPGAAYADIAVHGDGLTSLQFRASAGAPTQELRSSVTAPERIRIERRGNQFTVFAGKRDGELTATGPQTVDLQDPVYAGLGVCSHDADVVETAVFTSVRVDGRSVR
jgi:hypothetical protein